MSFESRLKEVEDKLEWCRQALRELEEDPVEPLSPRKGESLEAWKNRLLEIAREEDRASAQSRARTHTKEKGDLIIEERIRQRDFLEKRIEARISEMKKTLEEMKKK